MRAVLLELLDRHFTSSFEGLPKQSIQLGFKGSLVLPLRTQDLIAFVTCLGPSDYYSTFPLCSRTFHQSRSPWLPHLSESSEYCRQILGRYRQGSCLVDIWQEPTQMIAVFPVHRQQDSTAGVATDIAWFAPCPKCGLVGCAASPMSTLLPPYH